MKNVYLISALFAVAASAAVAQTVSFSAVDTDQNGVLSVTEIQTALPQLIITDTNNDNILSEAEAVAAVAGLVLPQEAEGDDNSTVGEADYGLLVAAMASAQ